MKQMLIQVWLLLLNFLVACVYAKSSGGHVLRRHDDDEGRLLMKMMRRKAMNMMTKGSSSSSSSLSFGMKNKSKGEMRKSKGTKKKKKSNKQYSFMGKGGNYFYFRAKKSSKNNGKGYKGRPRPRPHPWPRPRPRPRTTAMPTSEEQTSPPTRRTPTSRPPTSTIAPTINSPGLNPDGTWTQRGSIMELNLETTVPFSASVPIDVSADGNIVAMLLSDQVYVYQYNANTGDWTPLGQKLDIPGEALSLSADGMKLAVSLSNGNIRVYEYDAFAAEPFLSWIPMGPDIMDRSSPGEVALSADGFTLVAGGKGYESTGPTRVYQYNANNIVWVQIGQDIARVPIMSNGDVDISADGTIIAIGYPYEDPTSFVLVYQYDADLNWWSQLGQIILATSPQYGRAGTSVALSASGHRLVVGEPGAGDGGEVHVYEYDDATETWNPRGQSMGQINSFTFDTGSHVATSADGNIVTYGPYSSGVAGESHLSVFQYDTLSDQWVQIGQSLLENDETGTSWLSPYFISVALSSAGSILVTGYMEDMQTDTGFATEGRVRVFAYE